MERTMEYYLQKGFAPKMAAYFASGRRTITEVSPNRDFSLTLTFDNGEQRILEVAPLLREGTVFAPLRDWNHFSRVYLDEDHAVSWDIDPKVDSKVVWSNKVDLCPDSCYVDSVPVSGGEAHA